MLLLTKEATDKDRSLNTQLVMATDSQKKMRKEEESLSGKTLTILVMKKPISTSKRNVSQKRHSVT